MLGHRILHNHRSIFLNIHRFIQVLVKMLSFIKYQVRLFLPSENDYNLDVIGICL